ncbi:MAG: sigma-70 family RNA polymerase sigma factor [Acidobacteriia bacterium]|nr:sigma-70 family RNA polymerase sigma factor [Terriglobia bacterium]
MNTQEQSAVLEQARRGDSSAFEALYREFAAPVLGLCRHMLGTKEAAEDALHEVFIKVQRSMNTFNDSMPFRNWLFSVASHYCIDVLRGRQHDRLWMTDEDFEPEQAPAPPASPLTELIAQEKGARIRAAVDRLRDEYRLPLVLQYYSDLSYDEIAAQLHMKRNTVATMIFRGKQELRHALAMEFREVAR